ncbi:MAG TPA: hypothetical protein VLA87_10500, partial [Gaiellaceae bacterium]|nr:hypothetical protein [Gaiellaceae bacterium]
GSVSELAAEIAVCGNPNLHGDAAAAARVAANLVEINLATVEGDERVERARAVVASAERAASRAVDETE